MELSSGFDFHEDVLDFLRRIDWETTRQMIGNSHSSLIGLVGASWLGASQDNWLLDGPPTASKRRVADLILGQRELPIAVVEVEGTAYSEKLDTIDLYLGSDRDDLADLKLGLLVCYAYPPERPAVPIDDLIDRARHMGTAHPKKWVAVVFLEKTAEAAVADVMERNSYYAYRFNRASCLISRNGSAAPSPTLLWEHDSGISG